MACYSRYPTSHVIDPLCRWHAIAIYKGGLLRTTPTCYIRVGCAAMAWEPSVTSAQEKQYMLLILFFNGESNSWVRSEGN
jgi:hypothetical protein